MESLGETREPTNIYRVKYCDGRLGGIFFIAQESIKRGKIFFFLYFICGLIRRSRLSSSATMDPLYAQVRQQKHNLEKFYKKNRLHVVL